MSQLLLSTDEWIYHQFQQKQSLKTPPNPSINNQRQFVKFDAKLMRHLLPHRQFTQVATAQDCKTKKYSVLLQNISKKYKGLLSCVYHKLQGKASFFFQLLNIDGKLFKLQTCQMLIQFVRSIHLAQRHSQFPLKLMVNYDSLQVFFQIVYFSHSHSNLVYDMERTNKYTNIVLQIYKNFISKNLNVLDKALDMLVPVQDKLEQQQQKKLVQNLYRYANMMTMKSNFSVGEIISEQTKVKFLQQREESGRNLQMKRQTVQPESIKHFQLYGNNKIKKEEKNDKNKNQYYISGSQEKIIKKQIAFQLPQTQQENTKKFLTFLNPIYMYQPERLVAYPLNSGGFSQLFSAQASFWLAESISPNKLPELNPKNLQKKVLAVKKQSRPNGKNLHQVRILREIKAGYVPLLPRYYLPINMQSNPADKNPLLMMDMLIYGNLADFMKNRKKFTSLNNKLVLMFSITMGLRFLEKFKIVHLDFKPSNIMIVPGLLIKIIDFGQAYHSEVVKRQLGSYKPGITLPYSPPQASGYKNEQFTSKSDVYSLGVIFYQLIFGRRPFQNRQEQFLAPEECEKHGDVLLLRVLHWMISRCLSNSPVERPELDWISMILKICMYIVI